MTAIDPRVPIYPQTFGGFPGCYECFQRNDTIAACLDPRDGELHLLCRDCHSAVAAGRPPVLPTGEVLAATWQRIARWDINGEVGDELADRALDRLTGHLNPETAALAYEDLKDAIFWRAYLDSDAFDLLTIEPKHRDELMLAGAAEDDIKAATRRLTGGAR